MSDSRNDGSSSCVGSKSFELVGAMQPQPDLAQILAVHEPRCTHFGLLACALGFTAPAVEGIARHVLGAARIDRARRGLTHRAGSITAGQDAEAVATALPAQLTAIDAAFPIGRDRLAVGRASTCRYRRPRRRPLLQVTAGIVFGGVLTFVIARLIEIKLGFSPVWIGYLLVMLSVCLLACVVSARRALKVDPIAALRAE